MPRKQGNSHVVIIGGGFGGLEAAKRLKRCDVRVTLIDKRNYHLFQPLLYQVATGGLSPANIATPLRAIVGRYKNCDVVLGEVKDFDAPNQRVILDNGIIDYDYLIVAAGANHSYFGNDQWEQHAPGLKSLREATDIRRRIFMAFEAAEQERNPEVRKELMTFVVVGGGPTGVELAGALSEVAHHTLKHDFKRINPEDAKIVLVEASKHVLSGYPEALCECAEKKIRQLKIEIRLHQKITSVTDSAVTIESTEKSTDEIDSNSKGQSTTTIRARTVLWAAGVKGNPLGDKLAEHFDFELVSSARVPVNSHLRLPECENVFVIGDLAHFVDSDGHPLPSVAPVAIQQGRYVAKEIVDAIANPNENWEAGTPFSYRDLGTMATIGRAAAVAKIGKFETCGLLAWLMWLAVHLMQLVQFQNRMLVLIQWGWNYITFNRSARIITGETQLAAETPTPEGAMPAHASMETKG